jgi:UDP-sugar transporter A1/2/3
MDINEIIKWGSLVALTIHNNLTVFIMRYSKILPEQYISSTAVVCTEICKFAISLILHIIFRVRELGSIKKYNLKMLVNELFGKESDALKTLVPACLYLVQNNLQYYSMTKLDPATFRISSQIKHVIIAVFTVVILKRRIYNHQWVSIFLLVFGIILVQFSKGDKTTSSLSSQDALINKSLGLLSVFITCLSSGFAGVYFEKMLKKTKVSPWARNVQLSLFSVIPGYIIGCLIIDGKEIREKGFFSGYSRWTIYSIMCQTLTGFIVVIVIKYADNILKSFANSISIILGCIAQYFIFGFDITFTFIVGCFIVLYSSYLYGKPVKQKRYKYGLIEDNKENMEELKA